MKKIFKEYKVTQQRVWPYPNQISKGSSDFVVTSVLRRGDISGLGAQLLEDSVIADFNDFVFFDEVTCSCKTKYSVVIESLDDLSTSGLDESYEIVVDKEIVITAKSYVGAVYALATLQQLIRKKGDEYVIENTPLKIVDGPKVGFRSAMLDCSRHFLSVEFLKKQIKAMAFQKLNALHLHLTDGQSFPLDLGPYSGAIAQGRNGNNTGAYSAEEMYTREGIRELVDYARARGVRVIPEVDTPGHVYSWTSGYPEMMTCNDLPHQGTITCPEPPCGFFNLQDKFLRVKEVVTGVLGEVMDAFQVGKKGYGTYFHIGFDEVGCPNMKNNVCQPPSCTGVYGDLSVNYANWLLGWLKSSYSNVQVIMWIDQILTSNFDAKNNYVQNVQIDPAHVILQFWNLDSTTPLLINQLANKGFGIINSQSTVYYLDAGGEGSEFYFGGPQLSQPVTNGPVHISYQKYWMTTYPGIDPTGIVTNGWPVSWEEIYLNNITWLSLDLGTTGTGHFQNIPLKTSAKSGGIIGASASLWGEVADETNVEQKFWPKAAAHAESLWRFNPNRPADNIINARFRMAFLREDLLRLGIHAGPIVPGDVFRNAPWGPLNSKVTSLMYDINQDVQQVPEGYLFYYKRFWDQAATCPNPVNPFCGPVISHTMNCDGTGKPYIQQGC